MSIITPIDFKGENTIAQLEEESVSETVQWFIDKYEPKFLLQLMGADLYAEFKLGLTLVEVQPPTDPITYEPIPEQWLSLRDETDLKAMLVNYVYYYYMQFQTTQNAGTGTVKPKNDNSIQVSGIDKYIRSWNEMVEMVRLFDLSTETYPLWERVYWRNWYDGCSWHLPEIYKYKNTLGI